MHILTKTTNLLKLLRFAFETATTTTVNHQPYNRHPFHTKCMLIRTKYFTEKKQQQVRYICRPNVCNERDIPQRQIQDTGICIFYFMLKRDDLLCVVFFRFFPHTCATRTHVRNPTCLTGCQCPSRLNIPF